MGAKGVFLSNRFFPIFSDNSPEIRFICPHLYCNLPMGGDSIQ